MSDVPGRRPDVPVAGGRPPRRMEVLLERQLEVERRLTKLEERRRELQKRVDQETLTPEQRLDQVRRRNAAIRKRAEDMESRARLASMNPIFFQLDDMKRDFLAWAYIRTERHKERGRKT
ncbi:uncharacterized protein LOC122392566 [Amphibalanus amphitrite]|uniref:uncharacterized protein LOC122392566 n=1 Tax=Amphibalanus amphitrite TaxID=1232801 RepID=UPI001C9222A8|nr:uncharacterized protein LOC122392566 [Amphibalanus amphitrite]